MRVGVGLSIASGTLAAIREALGDARRVGGGTLPDATLLWLTYHHAPALPRVLEALRGARGLRALAGCVAPGVIVGDRELFDAPGVAAMTFHGLDPERVATLLVRDLSERNARAAKALFAALQPGDLGVAMLSTAAVSADRFLEGVPEGRREVAVVGGGAVNPAGPDWVFTERGPHDDALAVLVLRGCRPRVGLSQSCRPVFKPQRITAAQGRLVLALDDQPVTRALKAVIREFDIEERDLGRRLMVGLVPAPTWEGLARGHFVARPILGLEPRLGALYLGGEVEVGGWLTFLLRDPDWARQDLNGMALELARGAGARPSPAFALVIECSGRGPAFQGMPEHDAPILAAQLGAPPMAGFFSGFELAPVPVAPASLHLFSTVAALGW